MKKHLILCIVFATIQTVALADTPAYVITDLGALLEGSWTKPYGLNESSEVVGFSNLGPSGYHGFVWYGEIEDAGALDIYSELYAINEHGQATGLSETIDGSVAVTWTAQDGMVALTGHPIGSVADAIDINDNGVVVGGYNPGFSHQACQWIDGQFEALSKLPGDTESYAEAINNAGTIVGFAYQGTSPQGRMWANGLATDLGFEFASDINDVGEIVGSVGALNTIAVYRSVAGSVVEIGTLGGTISSAAAINDLGEVVGQADTVESDGHAFYWNATDQQIIDLNDLLPENSEWERLWRARDINNKGQIVGEGILNGQVRGFLMTPVPSGLILSNATPALAGEENDIVVSGATPNETIHLVYGLRAGNEAIPGCEESTEIRNPQIIGAAIADAEGVATFNSMVPLGARDRVVLIQAVERSTCRVSNLVLQPFN